MNIQAFTFKSLHAILGVKNVNNSIAAMKAATKETYKSSPFILHSQSPESNLSDFPSLLGSEGRIDFLPSGDLQRVLEFLRIKVVKTCDKQCQNHQ